ncbi:hypothetical protein FK268_12325 [Tsukamurella sputi]|uniref:Uncharacterized protein n=1 Tax=Tsukamurella sputi TaxID=2591848 RepID=A0A5C5RQE5_9ACTN|nr:hypothetical protein [Tsukamurella sputi]TWS24371.1 hypothetical protein FK268_12325 [Tsukamurella sputi]
MPVRTARWLAIFMGAMTVLWSLMGLTAFPVAAVVVVLLGVALVAGAVVAAGRGPVAPSASDEPAAGEPRRTQRVFRTAVALEFVGAIAAIVVLGKTGHPAYIMPAIALVVGLHFFVLVLAHPQFRLHIATGVVGTVGPSVAIVLMATGSLSTGAGHALAGLALALCTITYGASALRVLLTTTTSGTSTT